MKSISVIINEYSKHSIDLQDEYKLDEFVKFFENQLRIVTGYRLDAPITTPLEKHPHTQGTSSNVAELAEDDC